MTRVEATFTMSPRVAAVESRVSSWPTWRGTGRAVDNLATRLRRLMRKYINRLNQTRFARDLNREFSDFAETGTFATALLASYFAPTSYLILCNAGHPPPLWYRAQSGTWQQLKHTIPELLHQAANLPLGIIEPTDYHQFAVQLEPGDLVLIYSDAVIEASDAAGKLLGDEGLLAEVGRLDAARPAQFCHALRAALAAFRNQAPAEDDMTLLLLHHNGARPPRQSFRQMMKLMGKMCGLVKV